MSAEPRRSAAAPPIHHAIRFSQLSHSKYAVIYLIDKDAEVPPEKNMRE